MKIGVVCYPTYGGSGVVATELGLAMARKGHEVHFITYDLPTRVSFFNENVFYHKVDIRNYPLFKYPPYESALASRMVNVVKMEKLDLLHVHYAIPHASAAFMAKQILAAEGIHIPVVTTLHGTDITLVGKDETLSPVVSFSINASDVVTAVSESLKQDTLEHFTIKSPQHIEVIPNFVDLNRFKKQTKEHFKKAICPNGEKLLIHISNLRKVKRAEDVLMAFDKLRHMIPSKLLIVGDGPERNHLEEMCYKLNTCTDVRFLGKLQEIEEVLSIGDLFMMPSEKESFGLAALEAMACEVPVISSDVGGLPELNKHGFSGMICPLGDVDAMVKSAYHILQDENLPTFKANALTRAKDFAVDQITPLYESAYELALEKVKAKA
ncbi:N-acetyl-alpha-D-glucosaminyl L-malate synthase BshA [Sediminitomix flava]|uniref:N-acetyl-alpha-D-glucosaminyl L-malate synthase BshA n=1 Tax=Sediminitomix flava TaxID=379075 RepID=A0A315ZI68_SEDFL|nr:N-acetyl-alpha-D-glucosaminyl L-malate synthase BshA [Sediminitomix flava]PWJ44909.1 N-acetyl-alpha-D-glucosaminyl L-malate synthase BshA [Sediminitomix flava]